MLRILNEKKYNRMSLLRWALGLVSKMDGRMCGYGQGQGQQRRKTVITLKRALKLKFIRRQQKNSYCTLVPVKRQQASHEEDPYFRILNFRICYGYLKIAFHWTKLA